MCCSCVHVGMQPEDTHTGFGMSRSSRDATDANFNVARQVVFLIPSVQHGL